MAGNDFLFICPEHSGVVTEQAALVREGERLYKEVKRMSQIVTILLAAQLGVQFI